MGFRGERSPSPIPLNKPLSNSAPLTSVTHSIQRRPNKIDSRKADTFETYALAQLKKGEKLVRWERPNFMRAMGCIRAEAICLKCHTELKQGDLIGAFVYEFAKTKAKAPDEVKKDLLQTALQGKSLREIADNNGKIDKIKPSKYRDYNTVNDLERLLLEAGIVTKEMHAEQTESRKNALEGAAFWFEKNEAARVSKLVESNHKVIKESR